MVNCTDVCPRGIAVTKAMQQFKRAAATPVNLMDNVDYPPAHWITSVILGANTLIRNSLPLR
jgi:hypothetical protein